MSQELFMSLLGLRAKNAEIYIKTQDGIHIMTDYIDVYEINNHAFSSADRVECNDCDFRSDGDCLQLDDNEHDQCPFVVAVLDDYKDLCGATPQGRPLAEEFIRFMFGLEPGDKVITEASAMINLVNTNKEAVQDSVNRFFIKRISDTTKYREVLREQTSRRN